MELFTLRQQFEISLPRHSGCSHVGLNYIVVNFSVGGDYDGPKNVLFNVRAVIALLSVKNKSIFFENTF